MRASTAAQVGSWSRGRGRRDRHLGTTDDLQTDLQTQAAGRARADRTAAQRQRGAETQLQRPVPWLGEGRVTRNAGPGQRPPPSETARGRDGGREPEGTQRTTEFFLLTTKRHRTRRPRPSPGNEAECVQGPAPQAPRAAGGCRGRGASSRTLTFQEITVDDQTADACPARRGRGLAGAWPRPDTCRPAPCRPVSWVPRGGASRHCAPTRRHARQPFPNVASSSLRLWRLSTNGLQSEHGQTYRSLLGPAVPSGTSPARATRTRAVAVRSGR